MATSGSVDYDQTAAEIVKDALILVGGLEDDGTPSSAQEAHALRMLNRLVKAWSKQGLKLWGWSQGTLTLVADQQSYTLGPSGDLDIDRPIQIDNVRRVVSSVETPIEIVGRSVYMNQPSKDTTGKTVFVYYDPQLSLGRLYVWPAPDAADSIKFDYKSYLEDFDASSDDPYFPAEWLDALVYNLALRLMPMYEVSGDDRQWITAMAAQFLQDAEDGDADQGSVFLVPDLR